MGWLECATRMSVSDNQTNDSRAFEDKKREKVKLVAFFFF